VHESSYPILVHGWGCSGRTTTLSMAIKNIELGEPFIYVTSSTSTWSVLQAAAGAAGKIDDLYLMNLLTGMSQDTEARTGHTFDPINSWIESLKSCQLVFGMQFGEVIWAMSQYHRKNIYLISVQDLLELSQLRTIVSASQSDDFEQHLKDILISYLNDISSDEDKHADNCRTLDAMLREFEGNPHCSVTPEVDVAECFMSRKFMVILTPTQVYSNDDDRWIAHWALAMLNVRNEFRPSETAAPSEFFDLNFLNVQYEPFVSYMSGKQSRTVYSIFSEDPNTEVCNYIAKQSKTVIFTSKATYLLDELVKSVFYYGITYNELSSRAFNLLFDALVGGKLLLRNKRTGRLRNTKKVRVIGDPQKIMALRYSDHNYSLTRKPMSTPHEQA
jgi:hypothetical protein